MGTAVTQALHERVDPRLASNVEVLVVTQLDLIGPQRPADIVTLTGMSSGGVTKLLDRLEEHRLIVREYRRVKGDRRAILLVLTPEGQRVAAPLAEGLSSQMDAVRQAAPTTTATERKTSASSVRWSAIRRRRRSPST